MLFVRRRFDGTSEPFEAAAVGDKDMLEGNIAMKQTPVSLASFPTITHTILAINMLVLELLYILIITTPLVVPPLSFTYAQ